MLARSNIDCLPEVNKLSSNYVSLNIYIWSSLQEYLCLNSQVSLPWPYAEKSSGTERTMYFNRSDFCMLESVNIFETMSPK